MHQKVRDKFPSLGGVPRRGGVVLELNKKASSEAFFMLGSKKEFPYWIKE